MSDRTLDRASTGGIAAWFGFYTGTHNALNATVYAALIAALYLTVGLVMDSRRPSPEREP